MAHCRPLYSADDSSFEQNALFDHANSRRRYGVLAARFMRVAAGRRRMSLLSRFWPRSSA